MYIEENIISSDPRDETTPLQPGFCAADQVGEFIGERLYSVTKENAQDAREIFL